jgi:hypothetical protein
MLTKEKMKGIKSIIHTCSILIKKPNSSNTVTKCSDFIKDVTIRIILMNGSYGTFIPEFISFISTMK